MQHLRPPTLHDVVAGDDVEMVAVLLMFCFLPIEALNSQLSADFQFTTELIQLRPCLAFGTTFVLLGIFFILFGSV